MAREATDRRTPIERYREDLRREGFQSDPAQARAVEHLQVVYDAVLRSEDQSTGLLDRLLRRPPETPRGLYLWGGVGRGKTYLMDCFYEALPIEAKRRTHFHRFMEDVHDRLQAHGNETDPLVTVGAELADAARVLCFDEFFVSDIADAMILAELLDALFANGVTLLATSNVAPCNLYRDGLQRAQFLPAIDLLEEHTTVLDVDGGIDYRLRILERAEIYHHPLDAAADESLDRSFRELAPGHVREAPVIHVNHRPVQAVATSEGVGWFTFAELCEAPRSPADYIELARRFNTIVLSGVPQLGEGSNDPARRFIHLVDELYDRQVNLILTAAVAMESLYVGERLTFEFQRTTSRLVEMQTHDYLAREHRP